MKTIAIMTLMCAGLAACTAGPPTTAADEQSLVCDPNCDPGNFQALVSAVVGAGGGLGARVAGTMQCYHYEGGYDPICDCWHAAHDECDEVRQDPWGQQYDVWCTNNAGGSCSHRACGLATDPTQWPCQ